MDFQARPCIDPCESTHHRPRSCFTVFEHFPMEATMHKQLSMLLTAVTLLAAVPAAVADPPEGKDPDGEMRGQKATKDDAREHRKKGWDKSQAENREQQAPERIEKERGAAEAREEEVREKAAEERAAAREREEPAREKDDGEGENENEGKPAARSQGKKDMPPGLNKKDGAPQAGKGSETGQQKRQENSRAWWKFWE